MVPGSIGNIATSPPRGTRKLRLAGLRRSKSEYFPDRAALEPAIEVTRRESPARRRQIDDFLSSRPWFETATFCARCAQERALHLPPRQVAPCNLYQADLEGDPRRGGDAALALLQRMQRCGVSKWHPDPVGACEAARRRA
jgi:hypothetical protein